MPSQPVGIERGKKGVSSGLRGIPKARAFTTPMNNYRYHDPVKPWLILYCDRDFCYIIDRFAHKSDAQSCYRGLQVFVKESVATLNIINVKDESTWSQKQ